jgi:EAL domain-containing protein (putative c-di-GMP-specific phosphodiesterase class I)
MMKCTKSRPLGRLTVRLEIALRERMEGEEMELTPTQKEILARLRELNAKQAVALEKQVTSYAEFQEIEETESEIIALHRELVESLKPTQMHG